MNAIAILGRKLALASVLSIALFPWSAQADVVALTFNGSSTSTSVSTRGWSFATADAISVTALGWWDFGGDGLRASHQVGIWDTSGLLLMSGTVASGTVDPLDSGFRFTDTLSGTLLLGAGSYVIGGKSESIDQVAFSVAGANLTLAPGITFGQNRTISGNPNAFAFPDTTQGGLDNGVFGPSFKFDSVSMVPEPGGLLLVATALAGLVGVGRRRAA